jgi:ribosomal protein S18 acetylase RimI-like enzyme
MLIGQFEAARYWVWIDAQGDLAGIFGLVLPDTRRGHLTRFALAPGWRGRGLGKQAVSEIITEARAHGMTHLSLYVYESNHAAKRLYERHGFEVIQRDSPVADWSGDNLKMLLTL